MYTKQDPWQLASQCLSLSWILGNLHRSAFAKQLAKQIDHTKKMATVNRTTISCEPMTTNRHKESLWQQHFA